MRTLADLRGEIDAIDSQLAVLLAKRFAVTDQIGELKRQSGIAVADSSREDFVKASVRSSAGAYSAAVCEIYDSIFSVSRRRQSILK